MRPSRVSVGSVNMPQVSATHMHDLSPSALNKRVADPFTAMAVQIQHELWKEPAEKFTLVKLSGPEKPVSDSADACRPD